MISPSTLDRVKGLVSSKKTWCYCKLSRELIKLVGESGDKTDMVEMEGKRIRIKAGKQEGDSMRWIVPMLMLCAGCRSVAPVHHECRKPLEVSVNFSYNLPNDQGSVCVGVRK
jgi:hypothetical protein